MTGTLHIFLVEDDDDVALVIRRILERAGHQVTRCRSAADALIVLGHRSFDVVLLDHRLPDMAGLDLLAAIAQEGLTVPVVMVTAYGDENLATRALQAGALDYVVKDPELTFLRELPKRIQESVTRHRLQQMNRLLIEALESARDGIMITDLQGTILHVNRALELMTGYSRDELIGQNPRLLKDERTPPEVYAELWRTILARTSWQGELSNRRKDGTLVDVSLTISPIVDAQGQMTHFVGIHREMTERKLLERQLVQAQKMQSVGTLAGGVAHEFNNLLAGISGYAALGQREAGLPPAAAEFFKHIVALAERAASLTRQLLAFARKPTLVRRPLRILDLLHATGELVTRTLHSEFQIDEPAVEPDDLLVEADFNQLQQTLINLILNARDAGRAHSPIICRVRHVRLATDRAAFPDTVPPGDYVRLEIIDEGSGMSAEVLNQALDPFFTTKPVGKGTGLGLPVVFGIVRGHQGFLTIDSEVGRGTTVAIYLPRLIPAVGGKSRPSFEVGQVVEPESVAGRNILVLDDEEAVRDVVRRFLEIAGHRVVCAASSQEALRLLEEGLSVDLVILDLMMPREDGTTTFWRLRKQCPRVPVLLCTGLLASDPAPELLQTGSVSLLRKPFRMNELWYGVNQALSKLPIA